MKKRQKKYKGDIFALSVCSLLIVSFCSSILCLFDKQEFYHDRYPFFSIYPNDASNVDSWNWHIDNIELNNAWDIETDCYLPIGVVDSGIYSSNLDLTYMYNDVYSRDCLNLNRLPNEDIFGHGTMVAGMLGAQGNNNIGISGVMWHSNLVSLRIDNNVTNLEDPNGLINAINYASSNNIRILNFSGGFYKYGNSNDEITDSQITSLENALDNYDGLLICAAGNDDTEIGFNNNQVRIYPQVIECDNIIVVGASNKLNNKTYFSNYSSSYVDVFAPGDELKSTSTSVNGTTGFSGTSAASPIVAGIAGLLLGVNPNFTTEQIKTIILSTTDYCSSLSNYCVTGGKVNAYSALKHALPNVTTNSIFTSLNCLSSNDHQWYKINAQPGIFSFINYSGSLTLSCALFSDIQSSSIISGTCGGGGTFFTYDIPAQGTYYLKVTNVQSSSGNYSIFIEENHSHDYSSSYSYFDNMRHYALCSCGDYLLKKHVINSSTQRCLLCGGYAGIVNPLFLAGETNYFNDSYLNEQVLILGPIDYNRFVNGELSLDDI